MAAPIRKFLNLEAASAIVLLAAAVAALVWANSPLGWAYRRLFEEPIRVSLGGHGLTVTLRTAVTDGLMPFFFFLAGMEIKRELVEGELRTFRRALLPAIAALGGMVAPALLFALIAGGRGWGIPMATDIAFSLGVLKLLGSRVPRSLVVFMTALAIFDDIGGVLVIAIFYGHGLRIAPVVVSAILGAGLIVAGRRDIQRGAVYAAGGVLLWGSLERAGIHPALAGVVVGMAVPGSRADCGTDRPPMLDRLIRGWHPWVAFAVIPLFALASSGVPLAGGGGVRFGRVAAAVSASLFFGKLIGIFGATGAAVRLRIAKLPAGASWADLYGISQIAGIGFTVALFMAELAYPESAALLNDARAGIIAGSLASAVVGAAVLRLHRRP